MKRSSEILSSVAALLFQVALVGWLFCMSVINFDFTVMRFGYLWLSLAAAAAYFINYALVSKGIPAPLYLTLQLLLIGLGAWLCVETLVLEPKVTRTVVLTTIEYCTVFPTAAYLAFYGAGKNGMLLRFDGLAILMILLLFLVNFKNIPSFGSTLIMCAVALAAILLSQISERAGRFSSGGSAVRGNALGGRLMLAAAFLFVVLLTVVIAVLASGGVQSVSQFLASAITTIAQDVKSALMYLYGLLERFMQWLASLMGDQEMEVVGEEMMTMGSVSNTEEGDGQLVLPRWFYYVLAGIGVALLVYILVRLRRNGVKRGAVRRTVRRRALTKRESGLSAALAAWLATLREKLCYRVNCIRYRKTAPGLLVVCEKKAGAGRARRKDESGQEFLLRLAGSGVGEESARALRELAAAVEKTFYSPRPVVVSRELCAVIRRLKFT